MRDIKEILQKQREFYKSGATFDIDFRIVQLKKLRNALTEHEVKLFEALKADFNKSEFESYTSEIALVKKRDNAVLNGALKDGRKIKRFQGHLQLSMQKAR